MHDIRRYLICYVGLLFVVIGIYIYQFYNNDSNVRIVGSTTVYPFITTIAEFVIQAYEQNSPIIEPTGSGIGAKHFCSPSSKSSPHILMNSRKLYDAEIAQCKKNNIDWQQYIIGQELFVLITKKQNPLRNLSLRDIFLASAQAVPINNKIVKNPYKTWKEVNHNLPDIPIVIRGPHYTSGTYHVFTKSVMQEGAKTIPLMRRLAQTNSQKFKEITNNLRQDGSFISSTNTGSIVINKVLKEKETVGLVGFGFYQEHDYHLQLLSINHNFPDIDNTQHENNYSLKKTLYLYFRKNNDRDINDKLINIIHALKDEKLRKKLKEQGLIINHE